MPETACGSRSAGWHLVRSRSAPVSNSFRNLDRCDVRPLILKMPSSFGPQISTAGQRAFHLLALTIRYRADDNRRQARPSPLLILAHALLVAPSTFHAPRSSGFFQIAPEQSPVFARSRAKHYSVLEDGTITCARPRQIHVSTLGAISRTTAVQPAAPARTRLHTSPPPTLRQSTHRRYTARHAASAKARPALLYCAPRMP